MPRGIPAPLRLRGPRNALDALLHHLHPTHNFAVVEYDPAAAAKTVSADTLRALHAGSPVKTPGPPRAPTPFALPRVAVTKWVEDVLPYAVELHYRPGASKPSLRLKQRFFAGMEGKRSREAAEYARRDAKTALGMPPQSTAGLPPRGAEPRCYA